MVENLKIKIAKSFVRIENIPIFATAKAKDGAIAQLVEQRTENPCVPGSIPGGTTLKVPTLKRSRNFLFSGIFRKQFGVMRTNELFACLFSHLPMSAFIRSDTF